MNSFLVLFSFYFCSYFYIHAVFCDNPFLKRFNFFFFSQETRMIHRDAVDETTVPLRTDLRTYNLHSFYSKDEFYSHVYNLIYS